MAEKAKIWLAALIAFSGIIVFYLLKTQPMYTRLGAMFALMAAGIAVLWFSQPGRDLFAFFKESIEEAKRVTWPTRKETIQATIAVFVFVTIMALFLWGVDGLLGWITAKLLGA